MPEESVEITDDQMKAAAEQYDAAVDAGETPELEIVQEEPKEEVQEEQPQEPSDESPEGQDSSVLDSTDGNADEQVSSLTEGEPPEASEEPAKSKWAKNEERKSKTWKDINLQKESIKREREELELEKKKIAERQSDLNEGKAYRDKDGYTADEYIAAAEKLQLEGEGELAKETLAKAKSVAEEGKKTEEEQAARQAVRQHEEAFLKAKSELERDDPDLTKPETELFQKTNQFLKEYPDLVYLPDGNGLRHAVKLAKMQMGSEKADVLEAQNKELTETNNKLEKKLSLNGGYTSEKVGGAPSFDELSTEDQGKLLLQKAYEADNG